MRPGRFWLWFAVLIFLASMALSRQASPSPPSSPAVDVSLFRTVAREQNPVVVAIRTTRWIEPAAADDADWFERFLRRPFPRGPRLRREIGSGFLISAKGEILTNDHVIADAEVIEVQLFGRERTIHHATVVGRDPVSDSALIRLVDGPSDLPVATMGDSDALESGDWVMAIGNPFQLGHSVTVGVVSYAARSFEVEDGRWQKLIQTDASINPGSSGGPMLNTRGEVVGINLATLTDGFGDVMGVGFAVPINSVKVLLPQLRAGRVVRGSLGVHLRMALLTNEDAKALGLPAARGALLTSVDPNSAGEAAGLRAGDVISEFHGAPIETADDLATRVALAHPGSRVPLVVSRDGSQRAITAEIEKSASPDVRAHHRRIERPATFGLTLEDAFAGGSLVQEVEPGSASESAGIESGDILHKVNTRAVRTAAEAKDALRHVPAGATVFLLISREGAEQLIEIDAP
jgi:S1-C subfamily serine protease